MAPGGRYSALQVSEQTEPSVGQTASTENSASAVSTGDLRAEDAAGIEKSSCHDEEEDSDSDEALDAGEENG